MLFWNKHYVDCKCTHKPKFNSLIAFTNCTPKTTHFLDFCAKLQGFFSHADTEIGCNFFSFPVCKPLAYRWNYTKKFFFCNSLLTLRLWKCSILNGDSFLTLKSEMSICVIITQKDIMITNMLLLKARSLFAINCPIFFIFSFDDSNILIFVIGK